MPSGYAKDVKRVLSNTLTEELAKRTEQYKEVIPEPMNRQFEERLSKEDAIKRQIGKKLNPTELFPPALEQIQLKQSWRSSQNENTNDRTEPLCKKVRMTKEQCVKAAPKCTKCKQLMKGHKRNQRKQNTN